MSHRNGLVAALCCVAALTGCGAAISPELADARLSVERAKASEAPRYAPASVHDAEKLLARAESEKDGSRLERHFAYIADRQAQIAVARGNTGVAASDRATARSQYVAALERSAIRRDDSRQAQSEAERVAIEAQQRAAQAEIARIEAEQSADAAQAAREAAEVRAMRALERIAEVRQTEEGSVVTLTGEIIFITDEAELRPAGRQRLSAVADAIKAQPHGKIVVAGHTDSHGAAEYNEELSARRANAVRDFLVQQGVAEAQIEAIGRGEAQPVATNASPEGRANNRRVEIIISDSPR